LDFTLIASLSAAALFLGMLICSEIGRRMGEAALKRDPDGLTKGAGAAETAVFGLLGLLIAFTFAGAASRFEARRHLITEEVNRIGTAYLRVDLLPGAAQPELRDLFRRYLDARSTAYRNGENQATTKAMPAEAERLQREIWLKSSAASMQPGVPSQAAMLLLPALNDMIDITTTRSMAQQNHPPMTIFLLLGGLSLVGALLVGYGTSRNRDRKWFHTVIFSAFLSLTVYVIVDVEFPRLGLIRVDSADQYFIDLRRSMD